ncbi:ornithine carbamoyltransferase [Ruminococcaceae bacterium OttesenSCG-928-I18]|nr:ornithine carbamoyltransferase [Ruminococcaceae bacterium OttesenSCG-928-I18]
MPMSLSGRSFLTLLDYTPEEMRYLLDLSTEFKRLKRNGVLHRHLTGKNIVLLFEKTSTRTRCSFEVAGADLGLSVTYLDAASSQMGKKESIADTARVLGGLYDGIEYRGFRQETVELLAEQSGVPVWNGLTDEFHPTQALADLMTIEEQFGRLKGMHVTYMGDARNNVANSLMIGCAKMGVHFTACAPKDLLPAAGLVKRCEEMAAQQGGSVRLTEDVDEGGKNADALYTDVWVSMGEPEQVWETRIKLLKPYQVNRAVIDNANDDVIFLHCLPSFHDRNTSIGEDIYAKFGLEEMEVTDEVFGSRHSKVFEQAENRMHTIKALMYATLS